MALMLKRLDDPRSRSSNSFGSSFTGLFNTNAMRCRSRLSTRRRAPPALPRVWSCGSICERVLS